MSSEEGALSLEAQEYETIKKLISLIKNNNAVCQFSKKLLRNSSDNDTILQLQETEFNMLMYNFNILADELNSINKNFIVTGKYIKVILLILITVIVLFLLYAQIQVIGF